MDVFIAVVMLAVVVGCCIGGALAPHYKDNFLQCLGMCSIALWGSAEIVTIIKFGSVQMGNMVLYVGLFMFATGTYFKVHKFNRFQRHRRGIQ